MPPRRNVCGTASGFGDHLARDEEPQLDADTSKSDSLSSRLRARCNVMESSQLSTLHPPAIVHDRQRRLEGVTNELDARRARIEGVGDGFGEDRLFERTGVGIAKVFEEVLQVDASFTHWRILSRRARP